MRHQLEFDLAKMSNEKRARKNALRRRVVGSPAPPPPPPIQSSPVDPTPQVSDPASGTEHDSLAPEAELRRLASGGRSSDGWDVVVNATPPQQRAKTSGGSRRGSRGKRTGGGGLTGTEAMEGVAVLRNHEWVMERVKMRKREESRLKREKYGSKNSAIWSPSMEQVQYLCVRA